VILYPAIDIRDGHAVRLMRGDYGRETTYDADPLDAAIRWTAEGARFLHVVDLDGARTGSPQNLEVVRRITAGVGCPVQFGGGLRDATSLSAALEAGVERAVLGTAALRDPNFLDAALESHGERIVVSLDARRGEVALAGWTETAERDVAEAITALAGHGVSRFLFTPIEVDGTMEGPDLGELVRVSSATKAAVIYSGGVGKLADLKELARRAPANVEGVVVGRALYEGRIGIAQANSALERD